MAENMFTTLCGYEKVTYCENCRFSYTPVTVEEGSCKPIVVARFCSLTHRLVKDKGFCDEGAPKDD